MNRSLEDQSPQASQRPPAKKRIHSFPPLVNEKSRILILGSMPGRESLRRQEYYAHPRNAFWSLLFSLLREQSSALYEKKTDLLLRHGIALWDVLGSCRRASSLDSDIREETTNDFPAFFRRHPRITAVFFNGTKARDSYRRHIGFSSEKNYTLLPSTSPAYPLSLEKKREAWRVILEALSSEYY